MRNDNNIKLPKEKKDEMVVAIKNYFLTKV
jgi:hypothetical protein